MRFKSMFYKNPVGFLAALIMLLFSVSVAFVNHRIAMYAFLTFCLLLAACIFYAVYGTVVTKKAVREMNHTLGAGGTGAAESFPLPGALFDYYGNLIWYNTAFSETFLPAQEKHLPDAFTFFPDFRFRDYSEKASAPAEYLDRKYTVFFNELKQEGGNSLSMYFLDDTYFKDTEREYKLSRPFVMLIQVDNIENLYRQYTDSKFALVTSGIESRIEKWLKNENLIFKKTANGRFLVIGESRSLTHFVEERFSVLRAVREYKFNSQSVGATLSIGVGSGTHFGECEEQAKKALDMALGRGGDQAAVGTQNSYLYFGGMHDGAGDDSKVGPRQTSANFASLVSKFERVLIVGHRFSDYDSIGAGLGMLFLSHVNGVEARVVVSEKKTLSMPLLDYVNQLGRHLFLEPEEALRVCDDKTLLIIVDTHRAAQLECPELYGKAKQTVVIDHHRRSEDYISDAAIFYHRPSPSSASEMVAELIEYSSVQEEKLPPVIATALLSGIALDTKDFVLRTSRRTFEAAAYLRQCGADTVAVRKLFSIDAQQIALRNSIVAQATVYEGCMMISVTESTMKNLRVICSKAADEMLNVDGIRASFVISVSEEEAYISARSLGEENVQLIMERLGGGGHSTMSAAQLSGVTAEEAVSRLEEAIDGYWNNKQ